MSDMSQGPGWWQASDGKWYPPEQTPGGQPQAGGQPGYSAGPSYGAPVAGPGAIAGTGSPHGELAEWPIRVASGAIDFVALGVLGAIVQQVSFALGSLISLAGLAFGIYNGYLNGTTGQSVGKQVVGTRVVGEATGQPIGGGNGILRWLFHIVDGIICGIGYLFPLWDPKKQTIADKIAKTVVITGQPKKAFADAIKPS